MSLINVIKRTVTEKLHTNGFMPTTDVIENVTSIGGGCISEAYLCNISSGKKIFVKTCQCSSEQSLEQVVQMFASEAKGLKALSDTQTIRVPTPYAYGSLGNSHGYFAMEYIVFGSKYQASDAQAKLGDQLADLHLAPGPDQFGFEINNTIGSTFQDNSWCPNWVEFLRQRLSYQFELAVKNYPKLRKPAQDLLDSLDTYFEGLEIRPSLQHGDLWSGNWSVDEKGNPVIIDPAPFYGHDEYDLGIMKMFGGFDSNCYNAYYAKIPKQPGHEKRVDIYQLYHTVNHLNMFGSSYLSQSLSLLASIL